MAREHPLHPLHLTNRVQALQERRLLVNQTQHLGANAAHDLHVHHHVCGVRDLNTKLGVWRIEWSHAVWNHVHGAPFHASLE